jgi:hypothetical protein
MFDIEDLRKSKIIIITLQYLGKPSAINEENVWLQEVVSNMELEV